MSNHSRSYAFVSHALINTVFNHSTVYNDKAMALRILHQIRNNFILSKDSQSEGEDGLVLWIEGFELTDEEKSRGGIGNFARIFVHEQQDKTYVIHYGKVKKDIKSHPKKKLKHVHPNWGNWLLRKLDSRTYEHIEQAQNDLLRFYKEFPASTRIRHKNCISTIIWDPETPGARPTKKYVLEVLPVNADKFRIVANASKYNDVSVRPRPKVDEMPISPLRIYAMYMP